MYHPKVIFTPQQRADIIAAHESGVSLNRLAKRFGCDDGTIHRVVDPEYGVLRAAHTRQSKKRKRDRDALPPLTRSQKHYIETANRPRPEDVEARLAEIPPDTRSITGFLLGDPLPSRSALARRRVPA